MRVELDLALDQVTEGKAAQQKKDEEVVQLKEELKRLECYLHYLLGFVPVIR